MIMSVYLGLKNSGHEPDSVDEYWYDNAKPKYENKAEVYYIESNSLIAQVKLEDVYEDLGGDVEKISDTSNCKDYYSQAKKKSNQVDERQIGNSLIENEDKRIQTFDQVFSYLYGTGPEKVCKAELIRHLKKNKYND